MKKLLFPAKDHHLHYWTKIISPLAFFVICELSNRSVSPQTPGHPYSDFTFRTYAPVAFRQAIHWCFLKGKVQQQQQKLGQSRHPPNPRKYNNVKQHQTTHSKLVFWNLFLYFMWNIWNWKKSRRFMKFAFRYFRDLFGIPPDDFMVSDACYQGSWCIF